jgi:hypothetical protein
MARIQKNPFPAKGDRPLKPKSSAADKLLKEIRIAHHESRETYGSPRVYQALKQQDIPCSENRVTRRAQSFAAGLVC